jgi:small-conductance mechanosensitive channel
MENMMNKVMVDVKSAWASKINWTQAVVLLMTVLAFFGIDVPEDVRSSLMAAITAVGVVITWLLRTFFSPAVTAGSVK